MEDKNCKLIPFDIRMAKTPSNPDGLEVVTTNGTAVTIVFTDFRSEELNPNDDSLFPILAVIHGEDSDMSALYSRGGDMADDDNCDNFLYLKESITPRRMTNQELAWWLRDAPEEHREFKYSYDDVDKKDRGVHYVYIYSDSHANEPADRVLIRSNGGEWHEPLIDCKE
jgi:hypothetical protein